MKALFIGLALILVLTSESRASTPLWLQNLQEAATGTQVSSSNALDVYVQGGAITVTNPSVGSTGSAIPASGNYVAGNKAGNLTGLLIGQQTMANSLACVLPSDQSAIPVTGTFWQATQPVSIADGSSITLGAKGDSAATDSTSSWTVVSVLKGLWARLTTINATLGTPFQAGGALGAGSAIVGKVGIDQTTPGTTNGVQVNAALPAGTNLLGKTGIDQTTPGTTNAVSLTQIGANAVSSGNGVSGTGVQRVAIASDNTAFSVNATLQAGAAKVGQVAIDQTTPGTTNLVALAANQSVNIAQINGVTALMGNGVTGTGSQRVTIASDNTPFTVQTKAPLTATGSGSAAGATVSTVATLTAPANTIGFILMNLDTSTANVRWAVGRTASTTLGQQLQPGRDTGFVPIGANVSIIAESGTQNIDIQWIAQ